VNAALLVLPSFALIVVGLVLARRFGYGRELWAGLEKLVYYVLFPALLFRSLAVASLDLGHAGGLVFAACAFTTAGFGLALLARPLFRVEATLAAGASQCAYRFNTYIGLAVAGSLFGAPGIALTALLLGVLIPLVNFFAVAVLARHSERGFAREIATHPLVLSSFAGFAWHLAGWPLPGFADQTLALLAQAALPAGLLSVGAAMRLERGQGPVAAHAWWLAIKLAVLPALALALARALRLPPMESTLLVLCAALPTATSAYILAVRMTGDGRAVAAQVSIGTLLSMATLPLWIALA
jgi:malonate transporter